MIQQVKTFPSCSLLEYFHQRFVIWCCIFTTTGQNGASKSLIFGLPARGNYNTESRISKTGENSLGNHLKMLFPRIHSRSNGSNTLKAEHSDPCMWKAPQVILKTITIQQDHRNHLEYLTVIWGLFFRSTESEYSGPGLGIWMVHKPPVNSSV